MNMKYWENKWLNKIVIDNGNLSRIGYFIFKMHLLKVIDVKKEKDKEVLLSVECMTSGIIIEDIYASNFKVANNKQVAEFIAAKMLA